MDNASVIFVCVHAHTTPHWDIVSCSSTVLGCHFWTLLTLLWMLCWQIVVQVTDDLLSRASMTIVNSRPTLTINISTAREHWLEGMLRHEIGGYNKTVVDADHASNPCTTNKAGLNLNLNIMFKLFHVTRDTLFQRHQQLPPAVEQ